jgi:acetoin utilization deacetylase AcuC-like enzyme
MSMPESKGQPGTQKALPANDTPPEAGVIFVHDPELGQFNFGPDHPLRPRRHELLMDLLAKTGLLPPDDPAILIQKQASREELLLVHTAQYIDAVEHLSAGEHLTGSFAGERVIQPEVYGFGMGDNPVFKGMHEVCARIVGGTLAAARAVMSGKARHAFNPTGGLHHAMRDRASGFCIYNDAAVAIAALLREYEARILYVDFDAHHGDGVQWAFYDEPRVMTISFHETGRYLFPGTGDVLELGQGAGRGFAVNIPVDAFTEDDSWMEAVNALLPSLVEAFRPDLIVSQHGCDTHAWDPLTDLALTTRVAPLQAKLTHDLAHEHCQGRWVALGGGGYDIYRVVPRAWAMVWAELSGRSAPDGIPAAWLECWQPESPEPLPHRFLDDLADFPAKPRRAEIERHNRRVVAQARRLFLPAQVRQAYPHAHPHIPEAPFPAVRPETASAGVPDLLRLAGRAPEPRVQTLETERGTILLRDWSPPSLVERLQADEGLRSFARRADREQELLKRIASRPDSELIVAHTPEGLLVGQVSICAADEWWEGIPNLYEVAIEVSANWRKLGLANVLVTFALEPDYFEDVILFALGYAWHWDLDETGLGSMRYGAMIRSLFQRVGFEQMYASEPNLHMDPANIFLARIGKRVDPAVQAQFRARLSAPSGLR